MNNMKVKLGRRDFRFSYRHMLGEGPNRFNEKVQHAIEFDVYYSKGGLNVFHGTNEPRGICFSVSPIEIKDGMISMTLLGSSQQSGLRAFVLDLKRKNDKQLEKVAAAVDDLVVPICEEWQRNHEVAKDLFRQAIATVRQRMGAATVSRTVPADPAAMRGKGRMVLLTEELKAKLPKLGAQDGTPLAQQIVHAKFFRGGWTWWVLEGEPEGDDFVFFGFVEGLEAEFGNFSLSELESINAPAVERDKFWRPVRFGTVPSLAQAAGV